MGVNWVRRIATLGVLVVGAAGQLVMSGAQATESWQSSDDPKYLRLRTELIILANSGFVVSEGDIYDWPDDTEKHTRCLEIADRILESYPEDAYITGLRAVYRTRLEPVERVVASYRLRIQEDPDDAVRHFALFRALEMQFSGQSGGWAASENDCIPHEFQVALLPSIHRAVQLDPSSFLYRDERFRIGRPCDLELAVNEGLEIIGLIPEGSPPGQDPVNCFNKEWQFIYQVATFLMELKRYSEATVLLEDVVERWKPVEWNPELYFHQVFSQVFNNLAVCCEKAGRQQEARESYLEALRLNPQLPPALFNLAWSFMKTREYTQASRHFEPLTRLKPEHKGGWEGLAGCYLYLGERAKAIQAAEQLLLLDPDSEFARRVLKENPPQEQPSASHPAEP